MRVESVDKVDRTTLAVDCMEADFTTFENVLFQGTTEDGSTSAGSERI